MAGGEALDMHLVNDRLVERDVRRPVVAPVEVRVVHDALRHVGAAVVVVTGVVVAEGVRETGLVPVDLALDGLGVGVQQQLGRVAALALLRRPRPMHPVAIALPGRHRRQIGVPAESVDLLQADPPLATVVVEQAELDSLGDLGEQREIRARAVVGGAQRIRATRPGLDDLAHGVAPLQRLLIPVGLAGDPWQNCQLRQLGARMRVVVALDLRYLGNHAGCRYPPNPGQCGHRPDCGDLCEIFRRAGLPRTAGVAAYTGSRAGTAAGLRLKVTVRPRMLGCYLFGRRGAADREPFTGWLPRVTGPVVREGPLRQP